MHNSKRIWATVVLVALAVTAAGCMKTGREATFARTSSPVVNKQFVAVDDWSVWAAEIADRVEDAIDDRPDLEEKPIYMRPLNDRAFATGFYSLLNTELISRGLQVAVKPEKDVINLTYVTLPVSTESDKGYIGTTAELIGSAGSDTLSAGKSIKSTGRRASLWSRDEYKAIILSVGLSYNNRYVMHASSILSVAESQRGNFIPPYERGYRINEFPARKVKVSGE
ncbi:hypothetical protein [Halodesulfovibrio spirochaetisodalis]|uniref:hypothetical protein n=1 Tax=Halodesulfovibrio spirochaetisodalis TaxID=1560234 RepID=UPI0008321F66|nr:hypothetical protein [Halodesulfovibrio spirochaetisodalis]